MISTRPGPVDPSTSSATPMTATPQNAHQQPLTFPSTPSMLNLLAVYVLVPPYVALLQTRPPLLS